MKNFIELVRTLEAKYNLDACDCLNERAHLNNNLYLFVRNDRLEVKYRFNAQLKHDEIPYNLPVIVGISFNINRKIEHIINAIDKKIFINQAISILEYNKIIADKVASLSKLNSIDRGRLAKLGYNPQLGKFYNYDTSLEIDLSSAIHCRTKNNYYYFNNDTQLFKFLELYSEFTNKVKEIKALQ